jgi:hypothetical protein
MGAQGAARTDVQSLIVKPSAKSKDLVIYTEAMFSGQTPGPSAAQTPERL